MTSVMHIALILLILLQVKHMFADFYLQTPRMLAARSKYLHLGRVQHVGLHAVGSAIALLIVGTAMPLTLMIVLAEGLAHYHIDWGKGWYSNKKQHTTTDAGFWRAMGFDQTLHQFTYVAMIWAWVSWSVA